MALPVQGIPAQNETVLALEVEREKTVSRTFFQDMPFWRELRQRGLVKKAKSFGVTVRVITHPAPNAGFRHIGGTLPGEERTIGGATRLFDVGMDTWTQYMSHVYYGQREDGLFTEAATDGMSYGKILAEKDQLALDQMHVMQDVFMLGPGDGRYFEVASVSGRQVTVAVANETLANAGQMGLALARFIGACHIFVEPDSGTIRTSGAGQGLAVEDVDFDNNIITYDRDVTASAGDIAVEGDDDDNSLSKGPQGLVAAIGNSDHSLDYLGKSRGTAGMQWLDSVVIDFTNGANLGEFNPATFARGAIQVTQANKGRVDAFICEPQMLLEGFFGSLIEGGNPQNRTIGGPQEARRYMGLDGNLGSGGTTYTIFLAGYGRAQLMPMLNCPPNTVFGINWSSFEYHQYGATVKPLDRDGHKLRTPFRHTYNTGWWHSFMFFCRWPNRNLRCENIRQQQPRYFG